MQDIDWDEEWFPRIVFFNALSIDKMQKGHKLFYEHGDDVPQACETYRITGTFRENLELYNFPLDYQVSQNICYIILLFPFPSVKNGDLSLHVHVQYRMLHVK